MANGILPLRIYTKTLNLKVSDGAYNLPFSKNIHEHKTIIMVCIRGSSLIHFMRVLSTLVQNHNFLQICNNSKALYYFDVKMERKRTNELNVLINEY